jgi:hypothetical protein
LNESGRPDFNLLQHYRMQASRIHYFVFDLLVYNSRDLTQLALVERHEIMKSVLKFASPRICIADYFETSVEDMLSAIRGQGLEGVVAKRKDRHYEIGKRSGSWAKYPLSNGQEAMSTQKYRVLFSSKCRPKPDPKGPSILCVHSRAESHPGGPSWLTFLGHMRDSL